MSSRNAASLAFAIVGISALVKSISMLQAVLTIPLFPEEVAGKMPIILVAYVFPLSLLVATGVFLIVRRARLAEWAVFGAEEDQIVSPAAVLPELAFSVLGLYLVVSTLPNLGSLGVQLINLRGLSDQKDLLQAFSGSIGYYLGSLTVFVIGGYLFMSARGIGRWWRRHQQHGALPAKTPLQDQCPSCGTPFDPNDYRDEVENRKCSRCRSELPATAIE